MGRVVVVVGAVLLALLLSGVDAVLGQEGGDSGKPGGKVLGDTKCFLCHKDVKEAFAKSIHASLSTGEDSIACETCHGPGEKHMMSMGETKPVYAYSQLSPEAASKRCLSCHGRTAEKGSHIDGFLESKWLEKGMGCTSCHLAHAPAHGAAEAAGGGAKPLPKTIGEAACTLCHSDRPGLVKFKHRSVTEEALGCETCHGPGRAHVESRGDPSLIRNPAELQPPKSDAACTLCHSDKTAPDHFTPEPGKERCVDCHTIHPEGEVAKEEEPEPTPGRPPFSIELDEAEAGAVPENPFPADSLPAETEAGEKWAGVRWNGDFRFGYRFVDVDGNRQVYDQDVNLDEGARLFDFRLDGRAEEESNTSFRVAGTGVSDPISRYEGFFRYENLFTVELDAGTRSFVYAATGDYARQDSDTDELSAAVWFFPDAPVKVGVGMDLWSREGKQIGGLLVEGTILKGTTMPFDEDLWNVWVQADWSNGTWSVSARQAYREETLDNDYQGRMPASPTAYSLDFGETTQVKAPTTTVVASGRPVKEVNLEGKFVWSLMDTRTDTSSKQTGPGTGAGVVEKFQGTLDGSRRYVRAEVDGTWFVMPELALSLRIEGLSSDATGNGTQQVSRADPPAGTPVQTNGKTSYDRQQRRYRFQGDVGYRATDWLFGTVGYEYMVEDLDLTEDGVTNDASPTYFGPYLALDIKPLPRFDIDFLYRFVSVDEPFTEISAQDTDNIRLSLRYQFVPKFGDWKPTVGLRAIGAQRLTTNTRHDTSAKSWVAGLGMFFLPFHDLSIDASYDQVYFDTQTDVIRYYGGTPSRGVSEYYGRSHTSGLTLSWTGIPRLRIEGGVRYAAVVGDFRTSRADLWLGGEYFLTERIGVGTEWRWYDYGEYDSGRGQDEYEAWNLDLWVRVRF